MGREGPDVSTLCGQLRGARLAKTIEKPSLAVPVLLVSLLLLLTTPAARAQGSCADCHETDLEAFTASVHGFAECTDCHAGAAGLPHDEGELRSTCADCHDDVVAQYASGIHGSARAEGVVEAPDCAACHGRFHLMLPRTEEESPIHPLRLAETCGTCHSDPDVIDKFGIPIAQPVEAYRGSVHAQAMTGGEEAATCSTCHDSHAVYPASDPRSRVFHQRVPETCGTCHAEHVEAYAKSVHGVAAAHGAREAPVCTDCHGEHRILSPREHGSPVFASNVPKMTCGRCHSDLRLAEKYGLPMDKVPAYEDSYHGLAARAGSVTMAHCGSCHGVHDILPSSDPASHIHEDNLAETCGRCHPGAGTAFAIGSVHVLTTEPEHAAVYYVRIGYLWMIFLTIGGMLLHNFMDVYRKVRSPRPPVLGTHVAAEERMTLGFRVAHALLLSSFAVLVYTGFALTYPEAWWARPLLQWEESLGLRGGLHRAAAIVLLAALGFHLVHLIVSRRARHCIAEMRPKWDDWLEFKERIRYYLGWRPDPPHTPRLGYPEKIEYIALLWGMIVMAGTGFLLWYENAALRWLPKWVTDLATVIHFYEAVLATLAIVVWHLYFVIFDPIVYPMDTAWLTGRSHQGRLQERRPSPTARGAGTRRPPAPGRPSPQEQEALARADDRGNGEGAGRDERDPAAVVGASRR